MWGRFLCIIHVWRFSSLKISSAHRTTSVSPAVVFFPQGTYLVSSPIIAYYYTQLIGDARVPPTLLASPSFAGMAVIGELC